MSLELYNMTKDTKIVPKFRYDGKYIIPSHGTVDINEDTAFFFKPYASIGIVVRQKQVEDSTSFEPIEKETVEEVAVEDVKEEEVEKISEETVEATESVEVKTEEIVEEVSSESGDSAYSEEELSIKNYKSLKKIATDLGLKTEGVNKKADLISLIIGSQK